MSTKTSKTEEMTSNKSKSSSSSSYSTSDSKQYGRVNRRVLDKNSEEYIKRRQRNNVAVRKSRTKSKMKTQQTMQRVEELKAENEKLETKVKILSKELSFLKDLFLTHACNGSHEELVNNGPINSNVISSTVLNKSPTINLKNTKD